MVGASAFTTASATRDINIEVAADDEAIIGLVPSDDTDAAELVDDVLVIDTQVESSGLNPDATFTYGDEDEPENTHLFILTNNSVDEYDFEIEFEREDNEAGGEVTFDFYDDDGNTTSVSTDAETVTLSDGESRYVVLTVDTDGTEDGATLGGDLSITATEPAE